MATKSNESYSRKLLHHFATFLPLYMIVAALFWLFGQSYKLAINVTESLPGHVYLIIKGEPPTQRDEPVAFRWHDPERKTQYPDGVTFLKLAGGLPGDVVVNNAGQIEVNHWKLTPKKFSSYGKQLESTRFSGIIPPDSYFVVGEHPGSLDSRYQLVRLVEHQDIIGRAYELF